MKNLLLLSLLVLFTTTLFSQNKKGWEIGLDAGFNLATMTGKYSNNDDAKNKWIGTPAVGITTAYNFNPLIAITAGLYLIKSGVLIQYTNQYEGETFEWTQRERYTTLRIPIAARLTWGTTWQYYVIAGFYISKRLCGKYVYKDLNSDYEESGKIKFKKNPDDSSEGDDWILDTKDYRRLNVGVNVGGGVRREIGPGFLGLNVIFGYGFCDFYKWDDKNDKPDGYKAYRDMNIAFMFTYAVLISTLMNN